MEQKLVDNSLIEKNMRSLEATVRSNLTETKLREIQQEQAENIQRNEIDNAFDSIGVNTKNEVEVLKEQSKELGLKLDVKEKEEPKRIEILNDLDRRRAVDRRLIPEKYKDAKFNSDSIKANLKKQYAKYNGLYTIYNFKAYMDECTNILTNIRRGITPARSCIIGAPNGFGKSSFVSECLIVMLKQGWITAPYISLHELAEIRVAEEQRLMRPFSYKATQGVYDKETGEYKSEKQLAMFTDSIRCTDIVKNPTIIQSAYSWSEYINARCLFVHFTDIMSKDLESHVLYQLLSIRGSKGLPTIAMISTSLDPYIKDVELREFVWDEILEYDINSNSYDRLVHISCYKKKNFEMDKNSKRHVDKDTGIVE